MLHADGLTMAVRIKQITPKQHTSNYLIYGAHPLRSTSLKKLIQSSCKLPKFLSLENQTAKKIGAYLKLSPTKKCLGSTTNQPSSTVKKTQNSLVGSSPLLPPTCLAATCSGSHSVDAVEDTDAEGVGPSMAVIFFGRGVFLTT